jgi:hypothetical protein
MYQANKERFLFHLAFLSMASLTWLLLFLFEQNGSNVFITVFHESSYFRYTYLDDMLRKMILHRKYFYYTASFLREAMMSVC